MESEDASEKRVEVPDRPSRRAFALILVVLMLIGGGIVAAVRYYRWCGGAGDTHVPVDVTVADGATAGRVVQQLSEAGVIRCDGLVGRILLHGAGDASDIRAGSYHLRTNMTFADAFAVLTAPPPAIPTVKFTVPEGQTVAQIAAAAERDLGIPSPRFLSTARPSTFPLPPYLPEQARSLEGYLFPDTYFIPKDGPTTADVIERMEERFRQEASSLGLTSGASALGYSPYEIVTIASMIEREAKVERDRPLIAAVIYNRLKAGMTLGIDATLLYRDPTPGDGTLSASDLGTDNPYNTRINPGLPPTPIANPGAASLEAALHPAVVPYLYYVLCGADGHHRFSVSYARFLRDKATCLG